MNMKKAKAFIIYYVILSIVFLGGRYCIIETYNMMQGPVPPEAFEKLISWVNLFSYFYLLPALVAGVYILIRFTRLSHLTLWLKILLYIIYILLASAVAIVLKLIFILLFYGFAP